MYYYLANYYVSDSEVISNFRFQTIYDYYIRLRSIGYYSMSIEYNSGPTITINGRQDNGTNSTFLFMPLSFSLDSLWSRPTELGDVLNYMTITLRSPLASNFPVYVDVGIANSNFDGYNLTDDFYDSIVWAGEHAFTSVTDHIYTIEGTIDDAYWIVYKLSSDSTETVKFNNMGNLIEFKNLSCTFTHYEDKLDDVLVGIDGVNNTLNSGFSDINRGQLEIKDGLSDVNSSIGDLNNSIQDTNDKLDNIEDILNTDKSDQINSGQFAVDLTYENFALEMIDNSKAGFRDIFDKSGLVLEKYTSSFNFLSAFYTSFFNGFDLANDILYVFISISVTAMLLGSVYTKIVARADPIPVRYSRGPIYKANAYPALKPPKRRSLSSGRN